MAGDVDPRFEPEFQRGYDPAVHGTRPAPSPSSSLEVDQEPRDDDDLPPRRNPFLIALPLIGAAFLVAAVALAVRYVLGSNVLGNRIGTQDDNFWLTVASSLMPALVVGGLLSYTAWLALLALTPRRRRA